MTRATGPVLLTVLLTLFPLLAQRTLAAGPRGLPYSVFPPHTALHVHGAVSNGTIDCSWSFAECDQATGRPVASEPVMHTRTMDRLRRIDGWEEDGTVPSGLGFVLWWNRYPAPSLSHAACTDLARAQAGLGYGKRASAFPGVGGAMAWTEYLYGGATVNLICAWTGAIEIESTSSWPTGEAAAGALARRYQRAQIEAAFAAGRG
jgi:hypothetical protein